MQTLQKLPQARCIMSASTDSLSGRGADISIAFKTDRQCADTWQRQAMTALSVTQQAGG